MTLKLAHTRRELRQTRSRELWQLLARSLAAQVAGLRPYRDRAVGPEGVEGDGCAGHGPLRSDERGR